MKFSLLIFTMTFEVKLLEFYGPLRDRMLGQQSVWLTSHVWVGMYRNTNDALSEWVVNVSHLKEFSYGPRLLCILVWNLHFP